MTTSLRGNHVVLYLHWPTYPEDLSSRLVSHICVVKKQLPFHYWCTYTSQIALFTYFLHKPIDMITYLITPQANHTLATSCLFSKFWHHILLKEIIFLFAIFLSWFWHQLRRFPDLKTNLKYSYVRYFALKWETSWLSLRQFLHWLFRQWFWQHLLFRPC